MRLLSEMMKVGVHVQLFCSVLQMKRWYLLAVHKKDDVLKEENVVEGEGFKNQRAAVSEVEAKALQYVGALRNYQSER